MSHGPWKKPVDAGIGMIAMGLVAGAAMGAVAAGVLMIHMTLCMFPELRPRKRAGESGKKDEAAK